MDILIINSTEDPNSNPNLSGIIEILCERGHRVTIRMRQLERHLPAVCPHCYFSFENKYLWKIKNTILRKMDWFCSFFMLCMFYQYARAYDLILGIDREGIIEASIMARRNQTRYGLISYEIAFADETTQGFKKSERYACQNVEFAIVQDKIRGNLLSKENQIPFSKLLYAPVSSRGIRARTIKSRYLYDHLGISYDKRIALVFGSLTSWTMTDVLLSKAQEFPDNWVLVLHSRSLLTESLADFRKKMSNKVFFSKKPIESFNQVHKILHSADLGVALYRPSYDRPYVGKNLENIGFASGKISSYLQHGLPILVNNFEPWVHLVPMHGLGGVVENDLSNICTILKKIEWEDLSQNCISFFSTYLDLNNYVDEIVSAIEQGTSIK